MYVLGNCVTERQQKLSQGPRCGGGGVGAWYSKRVLAAAGLLGFAWWLWWLKYQTRLGVRSGAVTQCTSVARRGDWRRRCDDV